MAKRSKEGNGVFYSKMVIEKSFRDHLIEWIAAILSITGAIMNSYQKIGGFYVFGAANLLWMWFALKHKHYGLFFMSVGLFITNVLGIFAWN